MDGHLPSFMEAFVIINNIFIKKFLKKEYNM